MDTFVVVTTLLLLILASIPVLPLLGFDIRIRGRLPLLPDGASKPRPALKGWIALVLCLISATMSGYATYRFSRPKIVEKPVEKIVEKMVEKQVPVPCPAPAKNASNPNGSRPHPPKQEARDRPSIKLDCGSAPCAASTGQQGGITAGQINVEGPLPVKFNWTVEDMPSANPSFAFEKKVSITTSRQYSPATLALVCDSDVGEMDAGFSHFAMLNLQMGVDPANREHVFVHFDAPAMTPEVPLVVHLFAASPFTVTQIVEAKYGRQQ